MFLRFCISTYPRKGTETIDVCRYKSNNKHFNLSPQGDGNNPPVLGVLRSDNFNLSPQGDGNLSAHGTFCTLHRFQLIPARGRKHSVCLPIPFPVRFQLIPARGRKPIAAPVAAPAAAISTYPRKGTETVVGNLDSVTGIFQLIPARGRKQQFSWLNLLLSCDFNLSPQGDGNVQRTQRQEQQNQKFQLIPARGRKHSDDCDKAQSLCDFNLSPQGDGNIETLDRKVICFQFQLIPARGRKPLDASHGGVPLTISTYPRKGTETLQYGQ